MDTETKDKLFMDYLIAFAQCGPEYARYLLGVPATLPESIEDAVMLSDLGISLNG